MISFAAYLYRDVLDSAQGPIAKLEAGTMPLAHQTAPAYQANAYLRSELSEHRPTNTLYGAADGTGSADDPMTARHKAISEALERWAFMDSSHHAAARSKYFFELDSSTNGMAAFPGFKWQARRSAHLEALERWAVISWWDGRLKASVTRAPFADVGLVRIEHDQKGEVVILFHKSAAGHVAYGHAAGHSVAAAAAKAAVELARAEFVIARYRARGGLAKIGSFCERRCIHFSTAEGHRQFLEKAYAAPTRKAPEWKVLFDGEIPGPWSKYATVWRQVVEMPTYAFLDAKEDFFLW